MLILQTSCNNGEHQKAVSDSATVVEKNNDTTLNVLSKRSMDSIEAVIKINDSFNIAIKKMNEVIKGLADSSLNSSGDKKAKILSLRNDLIGIRDNTNSLRDNVTSAALQGLMNKLKPGINLLKSQLLKLQRLAESVENVVSILNIVDKAIAAAISGGVITAPVVLAAAT